MRRERLTVASHGDSYEGWARRGREFEQDLGVGGAAGSLLEAGAVADGLGQVREFAFEPPPQGADPEKRGVEAGEKLQVEVALANVRALVGQDDAQLLAVPSGVIAGKTTAEPMVTGDETARLERRWSPAARGESASTETGVAPRQMRSAAPSP